MPSIANGTLPAVSIIKPTGTKFDEHPGYSTVREAEQRVVELIEAVKNSSYWEETAIIITYDDFGGWYDHVPPPVVDRWGPGGRVPMLIISPHARKGFVDHTLYDTTSILRFIEWRYGLQPLADRDAEANNLLAAFFSQPATAADQERLPGSGGVNILLVVAFVVIASVAGVGMFLWRGALQGWQRS